MKILHTADWHLGKKLENFSRLNEQKKVMQEICEIAEQQNVDLILIAGDLYDTINPSTEALELFYQTLGKLSDNGKRIVIALAGNHDSPDKIDAPDPLARLNGIIFIGSPFSEITPFELKNKIKITSVEKGYFQILLPGHDMPINIIHTAYANELRLKTALNINDHDETKKSSELRKLLKDKWQDLAQKHCNKKTVNILLSHLYFINKKQKNNLPQEDEGEKSILHIGGAQPIYSEDIPKEIDYVALGHLHRNQNIPNENYQHIVYSGSPLAYSMSETNQKKFVMLFEVTQNNNQKELKIKKISLKSGRNLIKKKFTQLEKALTWLKNNPNTLVELTLITDKFLSREETKKLYSSHDGIISLIPECKNIPTSLNEPYPINSSQSTKELFIDYFKFKNKNQTPNKEILELFNEVLAEEEA